MMKIKILGLVLLASTSIFAQKTGEEIFKENGCNACHMLTDMKLVGPGLKGVLDRRDREWIKSWIRNSADLIAKGDEQAVALFEEYNKVPMLAYDIKDEEIDVLIDYISGTKAEEVAAPVVETPKEDTVVVNKPKEKSGLSKALSNRPLLTYFFVSVLFLLLAALFTAWSVSRKK
jgi:cytochrome c551/c552